MRRLAALLAVLVALFGLSLSAPQSAAADGKISNGVEVACKVSAGPGLGTAIEVVGKITGYDVCDKIGKKVSEKVHKEWKAIQDSLLGDVITSGRDVVKWIIKKTLTVALMGPSLDLRATGLFGRDATLAGMMTWLGLVIASFGVMWQIGKMAVTGQAKHAGRAALGWAENMVLSAVGVGLIALLLTAGDALTSGLVNATFDDDAHAYDRIVSVLVPQGVSNPITLLSIVVVLLVVGFIQLVTVFLRQAAIPIQCLLLPVAAGGRTGGDTTRQWAPRLITSICMVIVYKPMLAIIICVGFAEFGEAATLAEWLRGFATLVLAIIAPGPLMKIFGPFGEVAGGGLASGGMGGALAAVGSYAGGKMGGDSGGGNGPTDAVTHASYVQQSMGSQGGDTAKDGKSGGDGRSGDLQERPAPAVPGQSAGEGAAAGTGAAAGAGAAGTGAATGAGAAAGGGAAAAAGPVGLGIQVLDGVNSAVQNASGQIGNGGDQQ
ncbi:hypothetical protein [Streptomyces sp. DT195]|uniref:hypothetical protein n=1 Tax=Streptomyces sp. DT195 TaxID=3393419 RepID=UPI003CF86557